MITPLREHQLGRDRERRTAAPVERARAREEAVDALGGLAVVGRGKDLEPHVDAPDDEHLVLELHLARRAPDDPPLYTVGMFCVERGASVE